MLTDKSKEDFLKWKNAPEDYLQSTPLNWMYADIIEWLDSVGIYVDAQPLADFEDLDTYQKTVFITNVSYLEYDEMKIYDDGSDEETNIFQSRNKATEYGIKIANLIYNER